MGLSQADPARRHSSGLGQGPGLVRVCWRRMARLAVLVNFSLLVLLAFACGELIHGPLVPTGPAPEETENMYTSRSDGPKIIKMSGTTREPVEELSSDRWRQLSQHDSGLVDVLKQYLRRQSYRQLYHYQLKRGDPWTTHPPPYGGWSWQTGAAPYQPQPSGPKLAASGQHETTPSSSWDYWSSPWAPQPSHTKKRGPRLLKKEKAVQEGDCHNLLILLEEAIAHVME